MGLTERHWFESEDVPENDEWALEDAVYNSRANKKAQEAHSVCTKERCPMNASTISDDCNVKTCPWRTEALEPLKKQEPQPAIIEDFDVAQIGRCPSCNVVLQPWGANYCYKCGQAVKWE